MPTPTLTLRYYSTPFGWYDVVTEEIVLSGNGLFIGPARRREWLLQWQGKHLYWLTEKEKIARDLEISVTADALTPLDDECEIAVCFGELCEVFRGAIRLGDDNDNGVLELSRWSVAEGRSVLCRLKDGIWHGQDWAQAQGREESEISFFQADNRPLKAMVAPGARFRPSELTRT